MQPKNFSSEQSEVRGNDQKTDRERKNEKEDSVEVHADGLTVDPKSSRQESEGAAAEQTVQPVVQTEASGAVDETKDDAGRLENAQVVELKPCGQESEGAPAEQAVQPVVQTEASGAVDESKDDAGRLENAQVVELKLFGQESEGAPAEQAVQPVVQTGASGGVDESKDDAGRLENAQVVELKPCGQENEGAPAEQTVQPVVQTEASGAVDESKDDAGRLENAWAVELKPCGQESEGALAEQSVQPVVQTEASGAVDESKDDAGRLENAQVVELKPCGQESEGALAEQSVQPVVQTEASGAIDESRDDAGRLENRQEAGFGATWTAAHVSTLPPWLQENEFVLNGHRPPLFSFFDCFLSIFQIHSETGNIWSHLIAFYIMYLLTQWHMTSASLNLELKIPFLPYFISALGCLGFSVAFHTLVCHSEWVSHLFRKLDHCGIAILITGSTISWLYYLFYCHSWLYKFYAVLCMSLGIHSAVQTIKGDLSTAHHRFTRSLVFIINGLSAVVPCLHYRYIYGIPVQLMHSIYLLVIMAFFYITGALIYSCRVPERLMPGKFDTWFQSHQIFHVFVFIALVFFYRSLVLIAEYRLSTPC
ncbi:ADIPOR-like receptor [Trichinella papuae]|uniref:ADIPOR-like receptor n=1 Tax=Trichinella papuae TaxID=268474 RepID=A0A0V1M6B8_9BILA|nr:ADIPOR-like receptor [Trichinella papuae]